jgi:phospholipid/cholesterol/gamma-HCH transport system substrate-binding protein
LVRAGDALPKSLDFLLSFPFPPNATGAIVGNQVNLHLTVDLDATEILANLLASAPPAGQPSQPVIPVLPVPTAAPTLPKLPLPAITLPPLPLPSLSLPPLPLPSLPLPTLPGLPGLPLPTLPGLPIAAGAAPAGAVEGTRGGLAYVLAGGLSA